MSTEVRDDFFLLELYKDISFGCFSCSFPLVVVFLWMNVKRRNTVWSDTYSICLPDGFE